MDFNQGAVPGMVKIPKHMISNTRHLFRFLLQLSHYGQTNHQGCA